jgi:SAM-dependent methyltransferase
MTSSERQPDRPPKTLERVERQWTKLGEQDPMWAILTEPEKRSGQWEEKEFFETGVREIEEVLRIAESVATVRFETAIDFGCGVGRLSQALARRFNRVLGIDVSKPMIEGAKRLNRFPDRCCYLHNSAADLRAVETESADLVYSNITLQHMVPALSRRYIQDFFRVVRPGGQVIFQLPSRPRSVLRYRTKRMLPLALTNWLWRVRSGSPEAIESYFISEASVQALVRQSGGRVVKALPDHQGPPGWESRKYYCMRERVS